MRRAGTGGLQSGHGELPGLGVPFWLGVTLGSNTPSGWSTRASRRRPSPSSPEAREIFERLKARPWLERVERVAGQLQTAAV